MKRRKDTVVLKRDGTVERFSLFKLMNSIRVALEGRAYEGRLSGPLARAVELHLREFRIGEAPSTDYIFRCVASVLEQTGLTDVCEDMSLHRRMRNIRRRRTRVVGAAAASETATAWQKAMVVATLEGHYGLRHSVARFLAGQIEQQVFALNYRAITRPFLAELIRNEVLAWGLGEEVLLRREASLCELPILQPNEPKKES